MTSRRKMLHAALLLTAAVAVSGCPSLSRSALLLEQEQRGTGHQADDYKRSPCACIKYDLDNGADEDAGSHEWEKFPS